MSIIIREANIEDKSAIIDFQQAMALETENLQLDKEILSLGVLSVLEDNTKARYFIADLDKLAVGMLMITLEWSDWRNGWVWWIQSVYTKPGYRKMGVYKLLYGHVREIVENSENIRGLRLYVDKRNIRAQQVYESLGMSGEHYTTYEWMRD
ncbi:MAG: GNAT family N-acetyltransferase [Bacteroidales bacterium]|jgi:ribosomal protein S18 acetylase RimI-like enzyme